MAHEQPSNREQEIRFIVHSSHPSVSAADMATELGQENLRGLQDYLQERYGKVEVTMEREESFPIDWATAYLVVKLVGAAIGAGFFKEIGSDAYKYLKDKIKNGSLERERKEQQEEEKEEKE